MSTQENTGLGAAAMRALDFEMSEKPLLSDPLAKHLAGVDEACNVLEL